MNNHLLAPELMCSQISQVDFLEAMYPSPQELSIDSDTRTLLASLRSYSNGDHALSSNIPNALSLKLNLPIADTGRAISLLIDVPIRSDQSDLQEPPLPLVHVRKPEWMTKTQVTELCMNMPQQDLFAAIEYIQDQAPQYIEALQSQNAHHDTKQQISRVWFYFPSLSTREKREDLVNHAPGYGLTGFVLAGKPGVLCLEGVSKNIDSYMKFIKTESWGDIPAYQKKVSEKYREQGGEIQRVFSDMQEITDVLGEKRGERANRGDMRSFEAWLVDKGLGDAFDKVLM